MVIVRHPYSHAIYTNKTNNKKKKKQVAEIEKQAREQSQLTTLTTRTQNVHGCVFFPVVYWAIHICVCVIVHMYSTHARQSIYIYIHACTYMQNNLVFT